MSVYGAAVSLVPGDPVCLSDGAGVSSTETRFVTLATPAALAAAGAVLGIAASTAAAGQPLTVVDHGPVDRLVLDLGARNTASVVVVRGSPPVIRRAAPPRPDDYVLGMCDPSGQVTIAPRREVSTVSGRVVDVRDYGARGDRSRDASPAFEAAIAALPYGTASATIYVPPGEYRLSRDLHLNRPVHLLGAGGGTAGNHGVRLMFDAGRGIVVDNQNSTEEFGQAAGAVIENLRISGTVPPLVGRVMAGTTYAPNQRVHVNAPLPSATPPFLGLRYFHWECVRGGTSTELTSLVTAPNFYANHGFVPPPVAEWSAGKRVRSGQCVLPRFDGLGPTDRIYRCEFVTPGDPPYRFTGSTEPAWAAPSGSATPDGDVRWIAESWVVPTGPSPHIFDEGPGRPRWVARVHAGIRMHARCTVRNCFIEDFLNAGIYILGHTTLLLTNTDGWQLQNLLTARCGVGVLVYGNDANNGTALGVSCVLNGFDPTTALYLDFTAAELADMRAAVAEGRPAGGNGGYGFCDFSELGCNWIGCHAEPSTDRSLVVAGRSPEQHSVVVGSHLEGANRPSFVANTSVVIGGTWTHGLAGDAAAVQAGYTGFSRVFEQDSVSRRAVVALHPRILSGHADSVLGWTTSRSGIRSEQNWVQWRYGRPDVPGEWTFEAQQLNVPYLAVADGLGPSGAGWRDVRGHFRGHPHLGTEYFLGVHSGLEKRVEVRRGQRKIGDRFETNSPLAARGSYLGRVVVMAGFVGEPLAATFYSAFTADAGSPANTVEVDGFVYMCTRGGLSSGTLPTAPTPAPTWSAGSLPPTTWRPTALQLLDGLIRPRDPASHGYAFFRCVGLRGRGRTGADADEPNWSTLGSAPFWDGDVQWQFAGNEDPGWIVDEGALRPQWTRMGAPAKFAEYGPVYEKATATTSGDTEILLDRYLLPVDSCESFEIAVTALRKATGTAPAEGGAFVIEAAYRRDGTGNAEVVMAPAVRAAAPPGWSARLEAPFGSAEVRLFVHGPPPAGGTPATLLWWSTRRPK